MRCLEVMLEEVSQLKSDEARHGWVISLTDDERIVLINQHLLPLLKQVRRWHDDLRYFMRKIIKDAWADRMWQNIRAWTETDDAPV